MSPLEEEWVLGRSTEFIPFAPRRSHFWLDRDGMQEREKRNEFRSTTKIVARSWAADQGCRWRRVTPPSVLPARRQAVLPTASRCGYPRPIASASVRRP